MTEEKSVAQSYVLTESDNKHILKYYLISAAQDGTLYYGITISQYFCGSVFTASKLISENRESVLDLIYLYADNFVFPETLCELVDDFISELKFDNNWTAQAL